MPMVSVNDKKDSWKLREPQLPCKNVFMNHTHPWQIISFFKWFPDS